MNNDRAKSPQEEEYRALRRQLYWLCWTWQDYKGLFSSEENFDLMCMIVGGLANVIRVSMLDGIQLDICALTDPSESRNGNNLSLRRVLHWFRDSDQSADRIELLTRKLDEASTASSRMRTRRNKLIAHFDRPTILREDAEVIEWPSANEIERAVRLLVEAMNLAESLLGKAIHKYDFDHFRDGSETLMAILKNAGKEMSANHSD
jgi:hypothetical protein